MDRRDLVHSQLSCNSFPVDVRDLRIVDDGHAELLILGGHFS